MQTTLTAAAFTLLLTTSAFAVEPTTSGYAPVNGLSMYYETYGEGEPIVLIHGAYMNINNNWTTLIPTLNETHQVIAVELQGHGRTATIDRPITYEAMADDIAALLDYLHVEKADIFGYSMGATVAIEVAVRHPEKVDQLIAASGGYSSEAYPEGFEEMIATMTPDMFAGTPFMTEYEALAPKPEDFPKLMDQLKTLDVNPFAIPEEQIKSIKAKTLLIFGDGDVISLEHATTLFKLMGGGVNADMVGLPPVRLAILPATPHTGFVGNTEILKIIVPQFLAGEAPAGMFSE
jgi:pimeloyl-ACP methyl ester carboxylesterase